MSILNKSKIIITLVFVLLLQSYCSKASYIDTTKNQRYNFHFQQTVVTQYKPPFRSPYSGTNSLSGKEETKASITSTMFFGAHLWKNGEFYFNPEMAGGSGLSKALGVAGSPNGETFRVGSSAPKIYLARLYFVQTFDFDKQHTETIDDDPNQLRKQLSNHYLKFMGGKFCLTDFFDANSYSHDPRSQFLNWSLMANAAWDYPANTRGYTWGGIIEYANNNWKIRTASTLVPLTANGPVLDKHYTKANGETIELEKHYGNKRKGVIRVLTYYNMSLMGNYKEAICLSPINPNITSTEKYSRNKYGAGINWEQSLTDNVGIFAKASWNDGHNETWAYTEIDQTACTGVFFDGTKWKRNDDELGVAIVANGISKDHRAYLAAGGYGFIIGDGKLNYGNEMIAEMYYKIRSYKTLLWLSPDYQFIVNPAYNKDRGPVSVFSIRVHVEF